MIVIIESDCREGRVWGPPGDRVLSARQLSQPADSKHPNEGSFSSPQRKIGFTPSTHSPPFLVSTAVYARSMAVTRTLYTDLRQEGFQTYVLKNYEYLSVLSSFWILISLEDSQPSWDDFSRSQKISLLMESQEQWPVVKNGRSKRKKELPWPLPTRNISVSQRSCHSQHMVWYFRPVQNNLGRPWSIAASCNIWIQSMFIWHTCIIV